MSFVFSTTAPQCGAFLIKTSSSNYVVKHYEGQIGICIPTPTNTV